MEATNSLVSFLYKGKAELMKRSITIEINCGQKVCAKESGMYCKFFGKRLFSQTPCCSLFPIADETFTELDVIDGRVQRCSKCLDAEQKNKLTDKLLLKHIDSLSKALEESDQCPTLSTIW